MTPPGGLEGTRYSAHFVEDAVHQGNQLEAKQSLMFAVRCCCQYLGKTVEEAATTTSTYPLMCFVDLLHATLADVSGEHFLNNFR